MKKYRIFVFANLKPSQIDYKLIPLSNSPLVEHIYVLRKTPLNISNEKISCLSLPIILRIRPIYWVLTAFYGIFCIRKYRTNLILSYNIFPHGLNAFVASVFTKQKTIFSEINEDTIRYSRMFIFRFLIREILKNASFICTPGPRIASYWNNAGFNNTVQLHSTIDTNKFKPDTHVEKNIDFIYVGVFNNNKRPSIIIKAFSIVHKTYKSAQLTLIGYGKLEYELKLLIEKLKLENCVSIIKSNEVLDYIHRSRIFLMASLSEGLPCAMMEAMSCKLIVIVPSVGDIEGVVKDGLTGYLHDNSIEGLANLMSETYATYEELSFIQDNARDAIIKEHSFHVATSKWTELLKLV